MRLTALVFIRSGFNLVVFGTILAVLSYLRTESFRKRTGVNPWRIPPLLWALASFFVIVLGTLLSVIACATTKVPARQPRWAGPTGPTGYPATSTGPTGYPATSTGPTGYPPTSTDPAPAGGYGASAAYPPTDAAYPPADPAPPGYPPPAFPPGWQADPVGRHQHRYWDGARWTEHVADNGVSSQDPVRSA